MWSTLKGCKVANFYDEMKSVASDVFAEFKQGIIQYVALTAVEGATPDDPGEPTRVTPTVNATARPVSTKYVDGTHIVRSDIQISMPNDGLEPTMGNMFNIDGVEHQIVEIMRRPSAGTAVAFTVIVRR